MSDPRWSSVSTIPTDRSRTSKRFPPRRRREGGGAANEKKGNRDRGKDAIRRGDFRNDTERPRRSPKFHRTIYYENCPIRRTSEATFDIEL